MSYQPFDYDEAPFLGELPNYKHGFLACDVSRYVPRDAKEILIYAFITVKTSDRKMERAVYQIYTEDDRGKRYSQLMNTAFPRDDFVMNSANLWLPVFGRKEFYIRIPDSWTTSSKEKEIKLSEGRRFANLDEAMRDLTTSPHLHNHPVLHSGGG